MTEVGDPPVAVNVVIDHATNDVEAHFRKRELGVLWDGAAIDLTWMKHLFIDKWPREIVGLGRLGRIDAALAPNGHLMRRCASVISNANPQIVRIGHLVFFGNQADRRVHICDGFPMEEDVFERYISSQVFFRGVLSPFDQFRSRAPQISSIDSKSEGNGSQNSGEVNHPPFGRRIVAVLLCFICGFYFYDRGLKYFYDRRLTCGLALIGIVQRQLS